METSVVLYEPMNEVVTFDDERFYIKSSDLPEFEKACNEKKLIPIGDELVAVSSIKRVRKASGSVAMLESLIRARDLSETAKAKIRQVVAAREKDLMPVNEAIVSNIIEKYSKT